MMNRATTLKTIEFFLQQHSNNNGWKSPAPVTDDEKDEANQEAMVWNGDLPAEDVLHCGGIDDGRSSDVSSVHLYRFENLSIYSYNNNAWGHCDVFVESDDLYDWDTLDPIFDWLRNWDELPEEWLKEYVAARAE